MERSGWFDDDDEESPSEPLPSDRVWRHPSELGPHGAFEAAVPRRRTGARFVTALTLGTAGSLVLAVLASVHAFGPTTGTATGGLQSSLVGEGTSFGLASSTTRLLTVLTTVPADTTTSVAGSMPPMVQVRTGDADHTISAALVEDGSLVVSADDIGDATEGEAVLADGQTVRVVVERVDADTGVVHLRPATPVAGDDVAAPADDGAVWMGVSCGDGREPAPATTPAPSGTTTSEPATSAPVTAAAPSTTAAPAPASSAASAPASSAARPVATPSTSGAPSTAGTAAATTAAPTTVAPLGVTTTTVVAAGAPGTTTTTAAATVSGARVLSVFPGSPADGQLLAGDLIVSVNGRAVHSTWALVLAVRPFAVGTEVTVGVLRDGVLLTRTITLAAAPAH